MFLRRTTILVVLVVIIYSSISLLLRNRYDVPSSEDPIPNHPFPVTNPPSPGVVEFWHRWANIFDEARPKTPPIKIEAKASTEDALIPDNDDRTPTPVSIGLSNEDISSMRDSHQIVLDYLRMTDFSEDSTGLFNGTGIVTVAGGRYYAPALISIRMLRKKTNCTLPIQVFLHSSEEYEPHVCEELFPALNAECFVIEDFLRRDVPFKVDRFQLKVLAILFSSYENVLFLDSDCIPLHDPNLLLTAEPYTTHGFVSWPDYWIATEDPAFYTIAGFPEYPSGLPLRSSEAGQLLISKRTHLPSLILAAYYNVFGPTHYYPMLSQGAPGEGDKDTFLAAVIVRNDTFYRVQTKTGSVGIKDHAGVFHQKGMVQFDAAEEYSLREFTMKAKPRPFFLHANIPKMNVAHLLEGDHLYMPFTGGAKERIRLWGEEERVRRTFDYDIEKTVWSEMVEMACELEHVLKDFKKKKNLCAKAREHWDAVFAEKEE